MKPFSIDALKSKIKTHLSHRVARKELEDLSSKLSRYLSPHLYDSIFKGSRDAKIGTHRKRLTVFFSDIVDFTRMVEAMAPEDFTYVLNSYLDRMSKLVLKYGGTLDKFIGDAIVAFFGDPDSNGSQEDALACVSMAIEMRETLKVLRREWSEKGINYYIHVRFGISTGYCTVGNFGSADHMAYTIIGKQVNIASRLQYQAQPEEILISEETWSLVNSDVFCTKKEPVLLKGYDAEINNYSVVNHYSLLKDGFMLEAQADGFALQVDPSKVPSTQKEALIEKLKAAIWMLK